MLMSGKFVTGCLGFGVVSFLGVSLLQVPAIQQASIGSSVSSTFNPTLQATLAEADSVYREASAQAGPRLRSFAAASDAFVSSNVTTARLQFDGMKSTAVAHSSIDAWVPDSAPYWVRGGVQVAAQATGTQAIILAGKSPVIQSLKSDIERMIGIH